MRTAPSWPTVVLKISSFFLSSKKISWACAAFDPIQGRGVGQGFGARSPIEAVRVPKMLTRTKAAL